MNPTEKANELVDKFKPHVNPYIGSGMLCNHHDDDAILFQAKKCALIAVNEILQTNPTIKGNSFDLATMIVQTKAYWYRVTEEINKL